MSRTFTHLDDRGRAQMVNVTAKPVTSRRARAACRVVPDDRRCLTSLDWNELFTTARAAGTLAAKQTPHLIPLCHPLSAVVAEVVCEIDDTSVRIQSIAKTEGRTGVEMEALVACSISALTIAMALRELGIDAKVDDVTLWEKSGGRSGDWHR